MGTKSLGVIVGRFQTPYLHAGHTALITHIMSKHQKVLIFLGCSPALGTKRDPMDFETRKSMVEDFVLSTSSKCSVQVLPVYDHEDDHTWSKKLDKTIKSYGSQALLYGGRDSFFPHYHGVFRTKLYQTKPSHAATDLRQQIAQRAPLVTDDFRAGVIYGSQKQFPRVFMTVDIAVTKVENKDIKVLLGTKPGSKKLRFPGGFVDPEDSSLVEAAARELQEEAPGIDIGGMKSLCYVGSYNIEDWRYQGTDDCIMTSLFHAPYSFGPAVAGDDLETLAWYSLTDKTRKQMGTVHQGLYDNLTKYLRG